jgi:hypothetical protein
VEGGNNIYPPHGEWPWRGNGSEFLGWTLLVIGELLALVTSFHHFYGLLIHLRPVISGPDGFVGKDASSGMTAAHSFMDFFQGIVSLILGQTLEERQSKPSTINGSVDDYVFGGF